MQESCAFGWSSIGTVNILKLVKFSILTLKQVLAKYRIHYVVTTLRLAKGALLRIYEEFQPPCLEGSVKWQQLALIRYCNACCSL